ncbi:MAG: hypothetical protein IKC08_02660, partial [Lentisphaeria bacterium]|nr:hypothetical protein [Lentisphaeria bacterium]
FCCKKGIFSRKTEEKKFFFQISCKKQEKLLAVFEIESIFPSYENKYTGIYPDGTAGISGKSRRYNYGRITEDHTSFRAVEGEVF